MIDAVWHVGGLDGLPHAVDGPLVWRVRLDDPEVAAWARGAALRPRICAIWRGGLRRRCAGCGGS
jgi:hypothetical protein